MKNGNRVLFWFRNHLSIHRNPALVKALMDCTELIPVYCFDPREVAISVNANESETAVNQLIIKVSKLRDQLQNKGSNLLIVNNNYEQIIPSLARVLSVNEVISDPLLIEKDRKHLLSIQFRNQKTLEVKTLLSMHSIPFNSHFQEHSSEPLHLLFPEFPEIRCGQIPSTEQVLGMKSNNFRSVAC